MSCDDVPPIPAPTPGTWRIRLLETSIIVEGVGNAIPKDDIAPSFYLRIETPDQIRAKREVCTFLSDMPCPGESWDVDSRKNSVQKLERSDDFTDVLLVVCCMAVYAR